MSQFGPHIDPPLALIPHILGHTGLSVFQTTLRDPRRLSKDGVPDADDRAGFVKGMAEMGGLWGIAHASMLTSLGSPNPMTRNASASALVTDANLGAEIGLAAVCFHVGYAKGHDTQDAAIEAVIYKLTDVISRLKPGARVLLENGAEGTELGQTIAEVGKVARGVGAGPDKLGFVMDTCHMHVAGFDMADPGAPEKLAEEITSEGLAEYLCCLHLNDAKFPCGSKRDRHAAPGEGTIGDGLLHLMEHPMFQELPCILEMSQEDAARGISFMEQRFV